MEPITREETYLAKAAGQNVKTPEPITRVEHFLKNLIDHISQIGSGGGGGGSGSAESVQSDWNQNDPAASDYVKNRTHYEEGSGATIEWDGNTEGHEYIEIPGAGFGLCKVSDAIPTKEDVAGTVMRIYTDDGEILDTVLSEDDGTIMEASDNVIVLCNLLYVIPSDNITFNGLVFPSAGCYAMHVPSSGRFVSLTYGSTTIKTLDEKFIPDTIARVKDVTTMINEALGAIENGTY